LLKIHPQVEAQVGNRNLVGLGGAMQIGHGGLGSWLVGRQKIRTLATCQQDRKA
jgi:hypothetical protein